MRKFNTIYNRFIIFFYNLFNSNIRLNDEEVLIFFSSFYEYFKVYKDLVLSLEFVICINSKFKVFEKVIMNMKQGSNFSKSIEELKIFDDTIVSLINSGDCNNNLLESLEMVKNFVKNKIKRYNEIKNALIYPIFVCFVFNLVVLLFSYYVIPSLMDIFVEINGNLVNEIKYLLYFIFILKIFVFKCIFIIMFSFILYKKSKEKFYRILFFFRFLREIMVDYYVILITGSLVSSLKNNLDFVKAIEISASSISISFVKKYILNIKDEVAQGKYIHQILCKNKNIPKLLIEIVKIGENNGDILGAINLAYDIFQSKFNKKLDSFFSYIPLILIGFISIFLIIFVYLLFVPIYNLGGF